jgi:hypothetical protein
MKKALIVFGWILAVPVVAYLLAVIACICCGIELEAAFVTPLFVVFVVICELTGHPLRM